MQPPLLDRQSHWHIPQPDRLAVAAITLAVLLYLMLLPFGHQFPLIDDWIYYRGAAGIVNGTGFVPPEWGRVTLVSHAYWGALFAWLFGLNFTVLTAATLVMSLVALLACYALLRQLAFSPALSMMGVACLGLNYLFVTYSYTFHTDITFLALLLLSLVCYHQGIRQSAAATPRFDHWLVLGSLFAALTFLTRQYGLIVALAACLWLLLARRLSWRRAAAVLLIPLVTVASYYFWRAGQPPTLGDSYNFVEVTNLLKNPLPVLTKRLNSATILALPALGLAVPLLGRLRYWWLWGPLAAAYAWLTFARQSAGLQGLAASKRLSEQSEWWGPPIDVNATPLWWLGAALAVWLLGGLVEQHGAGLLALVRRRRDLQAADFLLFACLLLLLPMLVLPAAFYERYLLAFLPLIIAAGLTRFRGQQLTAALLLTVLLLTGGAGYAALRHLDDFDFSQTRWQAGQRLLSEGVAAVEIDAGFAWQGYYTLDAAVAQLGSHDIGVVGYNFPPQSVFKPQYALATIPLRGYSVLRSYPYLSRLSGFRTMQLLVQQRVPRP